MCRVRGWKCFTHHSPPLLTEAQVVQVSVFGCVFHVDIVYIDLEEKNVVLTQTKSQQSK